MYYENIVRQFFGTDEALLVSPLGSGNINATYRIDFVQNGEPKSAVLQRLNHHIFQHPQALMDNILRVTDHLARQRDYPLQVVAPLFDIRGETLVQDPEGNYWRMFALLENTVTPDTVRDPEEAYTVARAYGAFARALRTLPVDGLTDTLPGFHDSDRRWAVFTAMLARDPVNRSAAVHLEINTMLAAQPIFQKISQLKSNGLLPLRVTHNDTKSGNVLLDATTRQAVAVIDLDTVMPGTILSDFGDLVRTAAPNCYEDEPDIDILAVRTDILAALKAGFLMETQDFLTKTEIAQLDLGGQWIVAEQALRFLTDYLAGDVYYATRYATHNLVRAQNQLALLSALLAVR